MRVYIILFKFQVFTSFYSNDYNYYFKLWYSENYYLKKNSNDLRTFYKIMTKNIWNTTVNRDKNQIQSPMLSSTDEQQTKNSKF